ncbi:MAG: sulfatase-like hydrolase/transferase [Halorhabdus sp.]
MTQDIALVVLDTLRKDHFDEHFDWLPGRRHENAFSTSHWTVPAHASLFTGERPSDVGIHAKNLYYDDSQYTIAQRFDDSIAYTANPNISPHFGATKDFDEVVGDVRVDALREDIFNWSRFIANNLNSGPSRYLRAVYECISQDVDTWESLKYGLKIKLQDMDSNRRIGQVFLEDIQSRELSDKDFLFMNMMEAHAPYDPPEEYGAPDCNMEGLKYTFGDPEYPEECREAYDSSVRYLSDVYREVYSQLSESFDTVVTISDHGELLGEHGGWEHLYGISPELTHIPCVVSGDEIPLPDRPIDLRDIHDAIVGETSGRDALPVEYHGINERNKIGAQNKGVSIPDEMDVPRVGVANSDGYRYEHVDGTIKGDESVDERLLEEYAFTVSEGDTSVSESVKSQLEDLGYA